jgi:hypothetical protein
VRSDSKCKNKRQDKRQRRRRQEQKNNANIKINKISSIDSRTTVYCRHCDASQPEGKALHLQRVFDRITKHFLENLIHYENCNDDEEEEEEKVEQEEQEQKQ